jgi:hypothetical protein
MNKNLISISPAQYGKLVGVTKATVCNWCRAHIEKGEEKPEFAESIERMGKAWIIKVCAEIAKDGI